MVMFEFIWNGSGWKQLGPNINSNGVARHVESGHTVPSLSGNGRNIIAIGSQNNYGKLERIHSDPV